MGFWARFLFGHKPEPLPSFTGTVEDPQQGRVGICCSGGGVRSAAYNLGALQALQESDALHCAEYLAAVSGGSYIAAAFAMVANGDDEGDSDPELLRDGRGPFYRGSPEEQYLRNRASYLAPGGMGKLFLLQRVIAGLAFNLAFICCFLFAVGMLLAGALYVHGYTGLTRIDGSASFTVPPLLWQIPALMAGVGLVLALLAVLCQFPWDNARAACETWCARLLLVAGGIALVTVALPALVAVARDLELAPAQNGDATSKLTGTGAVGVISIIGGVLLQLRSRLADPATMLEQMKPLQRQLRRAGSGLRLLIVYFAGAVAGPLLLLTVLVVATSEALANSAPGTPDPTIWVALGVATAVFLFFYLVADITSWSLHPFYKRRLSTAFALRRVKRWPGDTVGEAEERDYDDLVLLSKSHVDGRLFSPDGCWPTLIVCAAANVSDTAATPPGRSVTSFTFSPDAVGGPLVGGVATCAYEDRFGKRRQRYLTLTSAVAMSGAALSPSMGKMTRRPLTFLMALANVRLGVWVPNPQRLDAWRWHPARRLLRYLTGIDRVPAEADCRALQARPRPSYLVREMLGLNHVTARHLYVTDGGHYENLGLVELLRRGCTDVYCFDASGGASFSNLGDAIALARTELGVEIEIDPRPLVTGGPRNLAERDCVCGTITFPPCAPGAASVTGTLVYARTVMTADAPWDVHAYHDADRTFPHDPTVDQLYTDQKFEAYRALGELAGCKAVTLMRAGAPVTSASPSNGPVLTPFAPSSNGAGLRAAVVKRWKELVGVQT